MGKGDAISLVDVFQCQLLLGSQLARWPVTCPLDPHGALGSWSPPVWDQEWGEMAKLAPGDPSELERTDLFGLKRD